MTYVQILRYFKLLVRTASIFKQDISFETITGVTTTGRKKLIFIRNISLYCATVIHVPFVECDSKSHH